MFGGWGRSDLRLIYATAPVFIERVIETRKKQVKKNLLKNKNGFKNNLINPQPDNECQSRKPINFANFGNLVLKTPFTA